MASTDKLPGKVLLTGASGFIGNRLRDSLLESGSDVIALRRPGSPEAKKGRSVVAEYADVDTLRRVMADEALRTRLVDAARARAGQLSWRATAQALIEHVSKVI